MSDDVWKRDEPSSPCVQICVIDPQTRLCIGCNRTGDEIAAWSRMSEDTRRAIMAELDNRKPARPRRGGRAARRKID